ncbi:hypothetical protein LPJ61_004362 [Coemansia biformis]|uniref:Uncharacterized protein n=1 Tax=Coemansia biformis TaxID=1286918 RepID=A0A9W8CWU5_9FUNG|nr:hypothetical protein LPJ61_004362 [Coemansia biformis]
MAFTDSFCSLSRTLCSSTHKSVLIKNAFQCQQELSKLGIGSPTPFATDMTLFYGPSLRARMMDLQPLNDPFVVDNIFKSPKKRRRGLLSWGMPPAGDVCGEKPASSVMLWGFSRHVRARNRRRSIMGSKYSLSSMRRRRLHASVGGEHVRSASDPTAALSPPPPKDSSDTPPSQSPCSSAPSSPAMGRPARPYIAQTPLPGGGTPYVAQTPLPDIGCPRYVVPTPLLGHCSTEPTRPPLLAFPKLSDGGSIQSPSMFRLSDSFSALPARPCCMASTLRGIAGHPAAPGCPECSPPSVRTTPYLSVGALRLASGREFCSSVAPPMPVLLRGEDRMRPQRCSLLTCGPCGDDTLPTRGARVPARVIFDPARQDMPSWPTSRSPFDVSGQIRFGQVKNSLDIRQPAPPCTRAREKRCARGPGSPGSLARPVTPLPPAMRALRWFATCGGSWKH